MKRQGLRPSKQQLYGWAILAVSGLALPAASAWLALPSLNWLMAMMFTVWVFLLLIDCVFGRRPPALSVARKLDIHMSVRMPHEAVLSLANFGNKDLLIECAEQVPEYWQVPTTLPPSLIKAGNAVEIRYQVTPLKRGAADITGTQVRLHSSLGLWQTHWQLDNASSHKVYPNFTAISDLAGLNGSVNLRQAGLKKYNMRGNGMDFLHLRDYREGESIRQIDWRATNRFNKLISKEYQEEKNQHIIIMLDSGRRMRVQDDDLSYFDHALNAILMLSYTALKNGDNLSLQSFGSESRWLSQVKSPQNVSRILHHFYDLYPEKIASDYLAAAQELITKQPKRALILMVSCLRDEDFDDLLSAVKLLQAKHLIAVISIAEPIYDKMASHSVESFDDALNYAASEKLKASVDKNLKRLRQSGVICLDVGANQLTPSVINTYLSVKKAGLL